MELVSLEFPSDLHRALQNHLLPVPLVLEEAAFVFASHHQGKQGSVFRAESWYGVPPDGFVWRSAYYLELTDETRAKVIKQAHDLDLCLVEFHSHVGDDGAAFSPSDLWGFTEFVPHVWWRLKGRPYAAMVVSAGGLDGLAWIDDPRKPLRVNRVLVGAAMFSTTGRSALEVPNDDE